MSDTATMTAQHANVFLPKEARILRVSRPTASEKHFTLQFVDGSQLEYVPGHFERIVHVRHVYACKACDRAGAETGGER